MMLITNVKSNQLRSSDITAVDASEVLDIMLSDYPHKYEEFRSHQRQRQRMGLEAPTPEVRPDRLEVRSELKVAELKAELPKIDPEKLRLVCLNFNRFLRKLYQDSYSMCIYYVNTLFF